MPNILPFVIIGIATGAIYGLAGVGLVLTYKTSGIFNFAHGALATLGAFAFYFLFTEHGMPVGYAIALSVLGSGVVSGLLLELLSRRLAEAPLAMQITATVGILIAIQSLLVIRYGATARQFPDYLPKGSNKIGDTSVGHDQMIVAGVSLVATVGLFYFLRNVPAGRAMRAIVDNEELVSLNGLRPAVIRRSAWIIGSSLAALSGVLIAPSLQLDATLLTLLVLQAFGAAAFGAFRSLPLTWIGGIVIGIATALLTRYLPDNEILVGLPSSLPFLVLIGALLLARPTRAFAREGFRPRASARSFSWKSQLPLAVVVIAVLAYVPQFAGFRIDTWTMALTHAILFMSLGLLVRTSGQVSLCHAAFAAVGATTFSRLAVDHHMPWVLALILAALVCVPIGALVALPAVRLSGLYLALATFGLGVLIQNMFYNTDLMFGASNFGLKMPRPTLFGVDFEDSDRFYYLVLGLTAVTGILVVLLTSTRLGRLLRALSDSPFVLATSGANVALLRASVFCISAFIAAGSGALSGMVVGRVTGDSYLPFSSLTFVVLIVIAVGGLPWYAIIAALANDLIPSYISGEKTNLWMQVIFGVSAVLVAVLSTADLPDPMAALRAKWRSRSATQVADEPIPTAAVVAPTAVTTRMDPPAPRTLEVVDLTMRFGGHTAIDGLSLTAPAGRITGLIGPNGAGKTTTFNICSALQRPTAGTVLLDGSDVTRTGPARRARLGMGRTFQRMELYDSLSVAENVAMGREAPVAGSSVAGQVMTLPGQRQTINDSALEALELCGLTAIADVQVGTLSTGQRRLVDLARCLAGPYGVLLLDEPSSGLDARETVKFGEILRNVVERRGCAILLVEHDMSLVMSVCEHIYVVDFGRPIFNGTPSEVVASAVVRDAYLGSTELEADLSAAAAAEQ